MNQSYQLIAHIPQLALQTSVDFLRLRGKGGCEVICSVTLVPSCCLSDSNAVPYLPQCCNNKIP